MFISAAKRYWCISVGQSASSESSFSAVHEIIALVHKNKRFDGESGKTEADISTGAYLPPA